MFLEDIEDVFKLSHFLQENSMNLRFSSELDTCKSGLTQESIRCLNESCVIVFLGGHSEKMLLYAISRKNSRENTDLRQIFPE